MSNYYRGQIMVDNCYSSPIQFSYTIPLGACWDFILWNLWPKGRIKSFISNG